MSTPFARSSGFAAFAAIIFSVLAFINGLLLTVSIADGQVGLGTVGRASWLLIFGTLALVYARRWRSARTGAVTTNDVNR